MEPFNSHNSGANSIVATAQEISSPQILLSSPGEDNEEETYVRFVRSIFCDDEASLSIFPDEDDDQDYMPEDDAAGDDMFGSIPDSDDDDNDDDSDVAAKNDSAKGSSSTGTKERDVLSAKPDNGDGTIIDTSDNDHDNDDDNNDDDNGDDDEDDEDEDDDDDEYDADDYGARSSLAHINRPSSSPKLVKVKSKELRELVDGCWQALVADDGRATYSAAVNRGGSTADLEVHSTGSPSRAAADAAAASSEANGLMQDATQRMNFDAYQKGPNSKSQDNSNVSNLVKHILAGGKPSDMCIDGLPVHAVRKLVARQMAMAMQLLLHVKLSAAAGAEENFAGSDGSKTASQYLDEVKVLRERAKRKAALIQMSVSNAVAVHKHTQDGQTLKKGAAIRSFVAANGLQLDSEDESSPAGLLSSSHHTHPTSTAAAAARMDDTAAHILTGLSSPQRAQLKLDYAQQRRMLTRWGDVDIDHNSDHHLQPHHKSTDRTAGAAGVAQPNQRALRNRSGCDRHRSFIPFTVFDVPILRQYPRVQELIGAAAGQLMQERSSVDQNHNSKLEWEMRSINLRLCGILGQLGIRYWQCLAPTAFYPLPQRTVAALRTQKVSQFKFLPAEDTLLIRGIVKLRGGVGILSIADEEDITGRSGNSQKLKELSGATAIDDAIDSDRASADSEEENDENEESGRVICPNAKQQSDKRKSSSQVSVWRRISHEFLPFISPDRLKLRFEQMTRLSAPTRNNKYKVYQMLALDYRKRDQRWTHEEDLELLKGFQCFGFDKWPLIQLFFIQNRALNDIRRRWHAIQKLWLRTLPSHAKAKRSRFNSAKGGSTGRLSLPSTELTISMKKFLCELNGISLERLSLNETANAAPLFVSSQRNFHHPMASDHNDPSQLLYATGRSVDPRSWHGGMHREAFAAFHAPGLRAAPPPAPMGRPGAAGRAAGRDQLGPSSVQLPPDALSLSGILDLPSIMTTPQKAPKHAGDADQLPSIQLGFTDTTFDQRTMISFTGIEDLMSPQQDAQKPTAPALQKGPVDFREFYAKQRALQPDRPNSESMRIGGSYCMPGKTSSASVDTLQRSSAATNNLFRPQTAAAAATATATAGVGAGSSSSSTGGPMSNASPPQPSTAELLHSVLGGESLMSLGNVLDLSAPGLEPSGLNARGHQQEQAALSVAPDRAPDGVADGRETRGAAGTAMSDMASGLSLIDCPSVFKSNLGGESKLDGASSGHSTDRVPVASGGSAVNKRPFQDMQSRARIAAGKEQEPQASGKCAPDDGSNSRNSADSSSSSSSLEFRADLFDGTSRLHVSDMTRGGSCSVAPINDAEHDCRGSLLPDCSSNFNGELTNVVRLLVPQSAENAAASKQSSKSDSRNSEDVTGEAAATPARPFEHITSQGPLILRSVDGDNTMSRKSLSNYSDDSNAALRSPKRKRAPDDEISSRKDRSNNHSRSNDSSNKKPKGGFFAMVMAKSNG